MLKNLKFFPFLVCDAFGQCCKKKKKFFSKFFIYNFFKLIRKKIFFNVIF